MACSTCTTTYTGPAVPGVHKQCAPVLFSRMFHRMVQTCKINEPEMQILYELFQSPAQSVKAPYWSEVSMTFWAFPPSEEAWKATLKLLLTTLQPRVYNTAETRHSQKEVLMVVPTSRLRTTPVRFERWIETFAENVGMSAGVVCFSEYFGEQMLTSMTRIVQGRKASSNPPHDKDFSLLFSTLSRQRREEKQVHSITGSRLTPENFMHFYYMNNRLKRTINELASNMNSWNLKRLELARIVDDTWPAPSMESRQARANSASTWSLGTTYQTRLAA